MSKPAEDNSLSTHDQVVNKTVYIDASLTEVWAYLTDPNLMRTWMFPTDLDIITDWTVGNPIIIRGDLHGVPFENKGTVIQFEPEKVLQYSHLSTVSRLRDEPANYSLIEFKLSATPNGQTALTLTLSNFPTVVIYKHLVHYWTVTLELIKRNLEAPTQSETST